VGAKRAGKKKKKRKWYTENANETEWVKNGGGTKWKFAPGFGLGDGFVGGVGKKKLINHQKTRSELKSRGTTPHEKPNQTCVKKEGGQRKE